MAPGFEAGLAGGVVMAAWMMLAALVDGMDPLSPLRPLGQTFASASPQDAESGAGALVFGLALHLLFSGAIGVLFAALLPADLEPRFASVMAVSFAFAVMGTMTSTVLPAVNPSLREAMPALGGSWVLAHAAYGATVGVVAQRLRQRGRARAAVPRIPAPARAAGT